MHTLPASFTAKRSYKKNTATVRLSEDELDEAVNEVCDEYRAVGLMTQTLWDTPVHGTKLDLESWGYWGIYYAEGNGGWSMLGFEPGSIYLPLARLKERPAGTRKFRHTLKDVLRHEFAHALAYQGGELVIDNPRFESAFGAHHDEPESSCAPRKNYVTNYAATKPREDFAETMMVYVRNAGVIPLYAARPRLLAKMRFVASLPRRIVTLGLGESV